MYHNRLMIINSLVPSGAFVALCFRWNFQSTNVLKLPKVPQYPKKGSTPTVQTVKCDICDDGAKVTASMFCMDCYKKMCDEHTQVCIVSTCEVGAYMIGNPTREVVYRQPELTSDGLLT